MNNKPESFLVSVDFDADEPSAVSMVIANKRVRFVRDDSEPLPLPAIRTMSAFNTTLWVRSGERIMAASNCEKCGHTQRFEVACSDDS